MSFAQVKSFAHVMELLDNQLVFAKAPTLGGWKWQGGSAPHLQRVTRNAAKARGALERHELV